MRAATSAATANVGNGFAARTLNSTVDTSRRYAVRLNEW